MDTDDALIAGLAHDLDGTFERLVLAHQDRCYSIALRMLGDPGAAEEAAQDALVRAYRAMAGYDASRILELRLRPWLATIVLNLCRTRLARRASGSRAPLSLDADPDRVSLPEPAATDPSTSPTAVAERRAAREHWAGLLATLPPAYRAAVVLRHVDGLSYPDLAVALGRPEGTVKAQVHRGLAMLRTALETANRLRARGDDRMTIDDQTLETAMADLATTAPTRLAPNVLVEVGLADRMARIDSVIGPLYVAWNGLGVSGVESAEFAASHAARTGRPVFPAEALPAGLARRDRPAAGRRSPGPHRPRPPRPQRVRT